jgi:hypothetical protein
MVSRSPQPSVAARENPKTTRNKPIAAADTGEEEIDVQTPPPGQVLGQHTAEQQPHGTAAAGHGTEDTERPTAVAGILERVRQRGQRRGGQQGTESALEGPRDDQDHERLRRSGDGRRYRESDETADERPLPPEQVGYLAAQQQQAAEGQRVRGDDPLPVVVGEAEFALGGRQGDIHDRRVQHHHQLGHRDRDQNGPSMAVLERAVRV